MQNWRRWILRPGGGADYRLNLSQSGLAEAVPRIIDPDPISPKRASSRATSRITMPEWVFFGGHFD
jgi:hypothetical protein